MQKTFEKAQDLIAARLGWSERNKTSQSEHSSETEVCTLFSSFVILVLCVFVCWIARSLASLFACLCCFCPPPPNTIAFFVPKGEWEALQFLQDKASIQKLTRWMEEGQAEKVVTWAKKLNALNRQELREYVERRIPSYEEVNDALWERYYESDYGETPLVTLEQLKKSPLRPGDPIGTIGNDTTCRGLQLVQCSLVNHISTYGGDGFVLEAGPDFGLRKIKLEDFVKEKEEKHEKIVGMRLVFAPDFDPSSIEQSASKKEEEISKDKQKEEEEKDKAKDKGDHEKEKARDSSSTKPKEKQTHKEESKSNAPATKAASDVDSEETQRRLSESDRVESEKLGKERDILPSDEPSGVEANIRRKLQAALFREVGKDYPDATTMVKKLLSPSYWKSDSEVRDTIFCTEHAVSCYKEAGIVAKDVQSSKVWPVHFERNAVPLHKGISLGSKFIIASESSAKSSSSGSGSGSGSYSSSSPSSQQKEKETS
ncbi:hypothetical protein QOT17_002617 [Balamuthia mandrillaris]